MMAEVMACSDGALKSVSVRYFEKMNSGVDSRPAIRPLKAFCAAPKSSARKFMPVNVA